MRGWCIDPGNKTIEAVELDDDRDIVKLVGHETIESDAIDERNRMYFDEECFLRGTAGRLQIDRLIPVSGKVVITGSADDGGLADTTLSATELDSRLAYLD